MAAGDTENYLTNPVNVYRLMKRLHTDWFLMEGRVQLMAEEMSELQGDFSKEEVMLITIFLHRLQCNPRVRTEFSQPGGRGGGCSGPRSPAEHLQVGRGPGGCRNPEWRQIRVRPQRRISNNQPGLKYRAIPTNPSSIE